MPMIVRELIVSDASFRLVGGLVSTAELDNSLFDIEGSLKSVVEAVPTCGIVRNQL
jgi:hypothetical protein